MSDVFFIIRFNNIILYALIAIQNDVSYITYSYHHNNTHNKLKAYVVHFGIFIIPCRVPRDSVAILSI